MISRDVEAVLARREACEVLFVGSSYVRTQVLTDTIDAEMSRLGAPCTTCKASAVALRGYELRQNVEKLLEHDWPRLRLVVVDVTLGGSPDFEERNWYKPRVVQWHTVAALPWLRRYYDDHPGALTWRIALAHAGHVAAKYARLGGFVAAVGRAPEEDAATMEEGVAPASPAPRGEGKPRLLQYAGEGRADAREGAGMRYTRRQQRELVERLKSARRAAAGSSSSDGGYVLELRELARARDVEAAFIHAPVYALLTPPEAAMRGDDRVRILDFDDPVRYPQLYAFENRGASQHLSQRGSELYSRLIAEQLVPLLGELESRRAVH